MNVSLLSAITLTVFFSSSCRHQIQEPQQPQFQSSFETIDLATISLSRIELTVPDTGYFDRGFAVSVQLTIHNPNETDILAIPIRCNSTEFFHFVSDSGSSLPFRAAENGEFIELQPKSDTTIYLSYTIVEVAYSNNDEFTAEISRLLNEGQFVYRKECLSNWTQFMSSKEYVLLDQAAIRTGPIEYSLKKLRKRQRSI